jgi:2-oxoglutarate/2-oxoacid ferredoxin oxidoreductase subunit beta
MSTTVKKNGGGKGAGRGPAAPPAAPGTGDPAPLTKKDFQTDQEVRWCPGCGDYAILNAVQTVLPGLGIPREKFVMISGIGCSSRFPYYMNTYGFHTIHGRAPAVATGLKVAKPDLDVWVITGDGDALSIGGNHLIHAMRRNVGLKILLFNNRIYGLTKGQYSPTSEEGKLTKSTPFGSLDRPLNPVSLALGAECTFVARSVDVYQQHLMEILRRAAAHKGTAFVEIFQNCNIFNDGAFDNFTERAVRPDMNIELEHGKPILFGANREKGLRWAGHYFEIATLGNGVTEKDIVVHDEKNPHPAMAFALSRLAPPQAPMPIGVYRDVEAAPFEARVWDQIEKIKSQRGEPNLEALLNAGDTWVVKE